MVRLLMVMMCVSMVGCATNKQKFVDETHQETEIYEIHDGVSLLVNREYLTRRISGRNLTNAPPFGGTAVADSKLDMTDAENWSVNMGQISDLYGGDISAMVEAGITAGVEAIKLQVPGANLVTQ